MYNIYSSVDSAATIFYFFGLQRLEGGVIVAEILRACISGLLESEGLDQIHWISFTYIKVCHHFLIIGANYKAE